MDIQIDGISYHIKVNMNNLDSGKIPVLFLHGFAGSSEDWHFLYNRLPDNYYAVSFDQIGHGKTWSPVDLKHYTLKFKLRAISYIYDVLRFNEIVIAGHSMGGRVAYSYIFNSNINLKGLLIESSTPGIEEPVQRQDLIKKDNDLAYMIEKQGLKNFINHWYSLPMFSSIRSLPGELQREFLNKRYENNHTGLMNNLRGFSEGRMPSYWNRLQEITSPVILLSGSLDSRYTVLAQRAVTHLQNGKHIKIANAGHNIHLERPETYIKILNEFLLSL